jgi:hypothetical protein
LMDTQVFRDQMLSALPSDDGRPVLHVDLGCGPGTASWSVMNVMSNDAEELSNVVDRPLT